MILAVSYGDKNFSQSLDDNLKSAKKCGKVDRTIQYGPESLTEQFKTENIDILSAKRGAGYWLWKPYIINLAISEIQDGDYLVYADSGSFYMKDIHILTNFMSENNTDVFLGELEHTEAKYSKRDAFVYMGVDGKGFESEKQFEASFLLVKKNDRTVRFLREWLSYCCDIRIISDDPNTCGLQDYPDFVQNRYDQTVLSLLAKKYGYKGYRPVDVKAQKNDPYPQVIVRTRFRNCNPIKYRLKVIKKKLEYWLGIQS